MVTGAGEEAFGVQPEQSGHPLQPGQAAQVRKRMIVSWSVVIGIIIIGFAVTVLTLNATLFSASGFARSYLDSLARHDVDSVLAMPGVATDAGASDALLRRDALGSLTGVELVSDVDRGGGIHRVTFDYLLDAGATGRTTFLVEHTGPRLGFFSSWSFAETPLAVLEVTPRNAVDFDVNGVAVVAEAGSDVANPYLVLVPGSFTLSHESTYLEAAPTMVTLTSPGAVEPFALDVQASEEFVAAVDRELAAYLDECATQQVLLPTGCPFGKSISDRIDGLPNWSMVHYPKVSIVPGEQSGTWLVPPVVGSAHLSVDVRSLFDGTVETLDEDVTFTISYLLTLPDGGTLTLTPLPVG